MLVLLDDDLGHLMIRRVRPWHRVLARLLAARLDRELADGAAPEARVSLAARAMQLTSAKSRRDLAASLLRLRTDSAIAPAPAARRIGPGTPPQVPLRRDRIGRAATELDELASKLLAPAPVPARGVAMVSQLLADGSGPLYAPSSSEDLRTTARRAAAALAA
ncbi:MAG: hypothetical protein JOY82_15395 [Streptosporangiaceae bacterium]|nr:hypothetical protein [Streptosporangiaceae bacterium]